MASLHLLMTPEFYSDKPDFVEVTSFANIYVIFPELREGIIGDNAFISYPEEKRQEIKEWLLKHEYIYLGDGSPMFERFKRLLTKEIIDL